VTDITNRAVNANSGNPHYDRTEGSAPYSPGRFLLLDVWGEENTPGAVYYESPGPAFVGQGTLGPHA